MKKNYCKPSITILPVIEKDDILLASETEINVADLFGEDEGLLN